MRLLAPRLFGDHVDAAAEQSLGSEFILRRNEYSFACAVGIPAGGALRRLGHLVCNPNSRHRAATLILIDRPRAAPIVHVTNQLPRSFVVYYKALRCVEMRRAMRTNAIIRVGRSRGRFA